MGIVGKFIFISLVRLLSIGHEEVEMKSFAIISVVLISSKMVKHSTCSHLIDFGLSWKY